MLPREPDWDQAFAINPVGAHQQQKIFQAIYEKLALSRNQRAEMEAIRAQENDRRIHKYAVDGFSEVLPRTTASPTKPTLDRELKSMRRTAAMCGSSEYEVATVYDPRMLTVLRKASKYDRMTGKSPESHPTGQGQDVDPRRSYTLRECAQERTRRRTAPIGEQRQAQRCRGCVS